MEGLSHILKLQGIPSLQENLQELILSIRHIWMRPEVRVAVGSLAVEPGIQGRLRILLCTDQAQDVALILPPKAVATLESKLAEAREHQAKASGIQ